MPSPNEQAGSPSHRTSRISGFYRMPLEERIALITEWAQLDDVEVDALVESLSLSQAGVMIENVVGRYSLPLAIGANFRINERDYLIPMVVEESSVVAAVSNAARLARTGGGFAAGSTEPIMIAQVQLLDVPDMASAIARIESSEPELLTLADCSPSITARGGGPVGIEVRRLTATPSGEMLVVHLLFDVRDAMGANVVNTAAEAIAPRLEELSGGRALLKILSNLSDRRRAWAGVRIPTTAFADDPLDAYAIAQAIVDANAFAVADPYQRRHTQQGYHERY